jgi:hypothetical protein
MTAPSARVLGTMLVVSVAVAGVLQAWDALALFGIRDGTLHWPAVGTFAEGDGETWYEPASRAIAEHARDGDVLVVVSDDANTWTWISYATYPRAWRYASMRAVPAVFTRLPRARTLVFAEWQSAPGASATEVGATLARQFAALAGQRAIRMAWFDARGAALFEIAP